jgi:hypothetical protein
MLTFIPKNQIFTNFLGATMFKTILKVFLETKLRKSTFLMPLWTLQNILRDAYLMLWNTKIKTMFHSQNEPLMS